MKKLLLLLPLFFVGCKSEPSEHQVLCKGVKTKTVTFDGYSRGPVFAFVIKGHSILFFHNRNGEKVIIPLLNNDCGIN